MTVETPPRRRPAKAKPAAPDRSPEVGAIELEPEEQRDVDGDGGGAPPPREPPPIATGPPGAGSWKGPSVWAKVILWAGGLLFAWFLGRGVGEIIAGIERAMSRRELP